MWSKGSIKIAQFSKYKITISQNRRSFFYVKHVKMLSILSGSRDPDGPDLPSPLGRIFQLSVHTLPDDGRSISGNVAEKHYDSRHDKLKNSMNTTESTNTNIFKNKNVFIKDVADKIMDGQLQALQEGGGGHLKTSIFLHISESSYLN